MRRCSIRACPRASDTTSGGASGGATCAWSSARASAIFAPLENVGLIIIDEEHEQTYISRQQPALRRAPSWRTTRCARRGRGAGAGQRNAEHALLARMAGRGRESSDAAGNADGASTTARCRRCMIVDMREELEAGNRSVFSGALVNGHRESVPQKRQAGDSVHQPARLLDLRLLPTPAATWSSAAQCDVSMTYHQRGERAPLPLLRAASVPPPKVCPECGSRVYQVFRRGHAAAWRKRCDRLFPDVRTVRMDNDTTRDQGRARDAARALPPRGGATSSIGTQMIAKGLDFPNVTLVGVVAADAMLNAAGLPFGVKRTFQLHHAGGRARGARGRRRARSSCRPTTRKITPWRPRAARITARFLKRRCAVAAARSIRRTR